MPQSSRAVGERLRELKNVRTLTVAAIDSLSQAQLDFVPRPRDWSIGEIADHLCLSETLWRGEIEWLVALVRAGQPPHVKRTFTDMNVAPLHLPDTLLASLQAPLSLMNRLVPDRLIRLLTEFPILPTRNPDAATPRRRLPRAALLTGLRDGFESTRRLLEEHAGLDFEGMTSEHPLIGVVNVPQMLVFLARHERRHQGQVERVRMDSRFPPSSRGAV